jgi:hypothetical protein
MGQAIPVRTDYTAGEVRRLAQRAKDAAQARGGQIGGMDRQTLRDWVIRFNEQGADGLINIPSPGVAAQAQRHARGLSRRIVKEGPTCVHEVVRWECDLIMRLYEEFGRRMRVRLE